MAREEGTNVPDPYFLWVVIRLLIAKTNSQPNWDLVGEAMGGVKGHTMYCRYNALCKKPPVPKSGNVPDLDEFINKITSDGKLLKIPGKSAAGTPASSGKKRKPKATPKKAVDYDQEDDEVQREDSPLSKKSKVDAEVKEEMKMFEDDNDNF